MAPDRSAREPRDHWWVLALGLLGLLGLLVVSGMASGQVGEGAHAPVSRAATGAVPREVLQGGPIVDPARPDQPGLRVPDRHVVLTFDDGPTRWTAQILDVLRAHGVRATFFVTGVRAVERPDLLERMRREGDEVGVHTFTHA